MTKKTFERRTSQLVKQVMQHPHKEELLKLMHQQLADDAMVDTEEEHLY